MACGDTRAKAVQFSRALQPILSYLKNLVLGDALVPSRQSPGTHQEDLCELLGGQTHSTIQNHIHEVESLDQ